MWDFKEGEWVVVATVIVGLFLFEAGPKILNFIKKKRSS